MMNTVGSVRIGNKRKNIGPKATGQECMVEIDRNNPILGNKYVLNNANDDKARAEVIAKYRADYELDCQNNGRMAQATQALAQRVKNGEKLILMCWCHPKPCHGDLIIEQIEKMLAA